MMEMRIVIQEKVWSGGPGGSRRPTRRRMRRTRTRRPAATSGTGRTC